MRSFSFGSWQVRSIQPWQWVLMVLVGGTVVVLVVLSLAALLVGALVLGSIGALVAPVWLWLRARWQGLESKTMSASDSTHQIRVIEVDEILPPQ